MCPWGSMEGTIQPPPPLGQGCPVYAMCDPASLCRRHRVGTNRAKAAGISEGPRWEGAPGGPGLLVRAFCEGLFQAGGGGPQITCLNSASLSAHPPRSFLSP